MMASGKFPEGSGAQLFDSEVKADGSLITLSWLKALMKEHHCEVKITNHVQRYGVSQELIWHSLWHNIRELAEMLFMFPKKNDPNVFIFHKTDFLNTAFVLGKLVAADKLSGFDGDASRVIVQTAVQKVDWKGYQLSADTYDEIGKYLFNLIPTKSIKSKLSKATVWIPYCPNKPLTGKDFATLIEKYSLAGANVRIFRPMFDRFEAVPLELWNDENEAERTRILESESQRLFQEWYNGVEDIFVTKGLVVIERAQLLREGRLVSAEENLIKLFTDKSSAELMIDSLFLDLVVRLKKVQELQQKNPLIMPSRQLSSTASVGASLGATAAQRPNEPEVLLSSREYIEIKQLNADSVIQGGYHFLFCRGMQELRGPQRNNAQETLAEFMLTYEIRKNQEATETERVSRGFG